MTSNSNTTTTTTITDAMADAVASLALANHPLSAIGATYSAPTQVGAIIPVSGGSALASVRDGGLCGSGKSDKALPVYRDGGGFFLALLSPDGTPIRLAIPADAVAACDGVFGAVGYNNAAIGTGVGEQASARVRRAHINVPARGIAGSKDSASLLALWAQQAPADPREARRPALDAARAAVHEVWALIQDLASDMPLADAQRMAGRLIATGRQAAPKDAAPMASALDAWMDLIAHERALDADIPRWDVSADALREHISSLTPVSAEEIIAHLREQLEQAREHIAGLEALAALPE